MTTTGEPDALERLVQFQHPGKLLDVAGLPGVDELDQQAIAALLGIGEPEYTAALDEFRRRAGRTALELGAVPEVASAIARVPVASQEQIVAVGDSLVDDLQSWAEILRELFVCLPEGPPRVTNAGISGDTTTAVLARLPALLESRPRWLVIMVGLNDARRHGDGRAPMLVSNRETKSNLREIRRQITLVDPLPGVFWITPPPVLPHLIAADPWLKSRKVSWRADDVTRKAELVSAMPDPVVDLRTAMGVPPDPAFLLDDGLHLSLRGQALVTRLLVEMWVKSA